MSAAELTAVLGALTALVVAVGALLVQVRQLHGLVNSRMGELLALTRRAALAEGKITTAPREELPTEIGGELPTDGDPRP
jgi:hypothetical protein